MALSANQIEAIYISANQKASSEHQFENQSQCFKYFVNGSDHAKWRQPKMIELWPPGGA